MLKLIYGKEQIVGVIGDPAQSIYSFQDADEKILEKHGENIDIPSYKLENNHRSNNEIVELLNTVRTDNLIQTSKRDSSKCLKILIGSHKQAFEYIKNEDDCHVLAYKTKDINKLKFNVENINETNYEKFSNNNDRRKGVIFNIIQAIELFKGYDIKKALHHMHFAYRDTEFKDNDEYLIKKLFELSEGKFEKLSLTEFYNTYIQKDIKELAEIRRGKVKELFDSINYEDVLANITINDSTLFRTIHSCKGDEFNSVLLLLNSQEKLDFIINPNISLEENRVYYVAISRAKEKIFINVPLLNESNSQKLENIGFEIVDLNKKLEEN